MTHLTHSTKSVRQEDVKRAWHLIDLKGEVLGRSVGKISTLLQGKHKVDYAPYSDAGDNVVVINARSVRLTGKKAATKTYTSYSGHPGGLRKETFAGLQKTDPEKIIRRAVSGMLPKNTLRDKRLARLFIFPEGNHTFQDKVGTK